MYKHYLTITLVLLLTQVSYSQRMSDSQINSILSLERYYPKIRDINKLQAIDELLLRVNYDFSYVVDTAKMSRYDEPMVLDIGKYTNRYYSYNSFLRDSMQMAENNKGPVSSGDGYGYRNITNFVIPEDQTATYLDIFTNHSIREREVTLRVDASEFVYNEELEQIAWRFTDTTKTSILGYSCFVAECYFRGRNWRVWFAVDIPYPYGMWKFNGLPGIILKAEDSQGFFQWQAVGIENGRERKIYRYNENIRLSKKNDVGKLWQRMWCAPHTLNYLFRGDQVMNVSLPDGTSREVKVDMYMPNKFYPKLEIE